MAAKKTFKKSSSKSKPSKAPAAKKSTSSSKPSEAHRILALWPPISDVQRGAFEGQFSIERCVDWGGRTQSANVVKDAFAFAHTIDEALRKYPTALRRYSPARFAWFLECIAKLEGARDTMIAGKDSAAPAKRNADQALMKATQVRRELAHALEMLTSDHPLDRQELERATGSAESPQETIDSLRALAKVGDQWLRRTDGESKALVASVDLQRGDVDLAWAAATDLEDAITTTPARRGNPQNDTREVNAIEGRVLLEMRYAMDAFGNARQSNPLVPNLVPGPGTRGAFTRSKPKAEPKKAKNGATATPQTPPN